MRFDLMDSPPPRGVTFSVEASGHLVVPAVFKTDVAEYLGQAGSIPVRLREQCGHNSGREWRKSTPQVQLRDA
jgi:hypothetical protein